MFSLFIKIGNMGCDFSFEDQGYDGDGIIQECHCENCGARIMYFISFDNDDEQAEKQNKNQEVIYGDKND